MRTNNVEWLTRYKKMAPEKKSKLAQAKLKNIGCIFIHNIDDVVTGRTYLFNTKTKERVNATEEYVHLLSNLRFEWDIQLIAIGRVKGQLPYLKHKGYSFKNHVKQSELAETLGAIHYKYFLDVIPPQQRINLAWVGLPHEADDILTDEAYLRELLYKFGALRSTGVLRDGREYNSP